MNIGKIEENIQKLTQNFSQEEFIYDLLLAYNLPKATVSRVKNGTSNLSKKDGEILLKKKVLFREVFDQDLHACIDQLRRDDNTLKHSPRFVIVTDYKTLLAYDTKNKDTLDTSVQDLPKYYDFFLPWSGREKAQVKPESLADVKAAEKMAKLYDVIRQDNPAQFHDRDSLHELNVFLSRLLFCFFAEDTAIFPKKLFVNSIESHTQADGSDLSEYLGRLFEVLNTKERSSFPKYLDAFEYVNGGLFADDYKAPKFSARSRKILIECGELNWADINPDIFGSMIQAVVHPDQRGGMGMHYTSVSNIMKVIEPLFLNELHEEFENNQHNPQKLDKLLNRLSTIRIFDPACGSGNFLIIAYKELRLLEIKILKQLKILSEAVRGFDDAQTSLIPKAQMSLASSYVPQLFSRINLSQFYGIELDDFAHEIAILSLWLAEHQMNVKFNEEFQKRLPSLPLKQGGKIIRDNAAELDWEKICPKSEKAEVYLLGNPPYKGSSKQSAEQKADMSNALKDIKGYKNLDYISPWFIKGSLYIQGISAKLAFVSTNSICQGQQVELLWPNILNKGLEIDFCHQSFKWTNNAKANAGVTCVIIGLRNNSRQEKKIFCNDSMQIVDNINPYLSRGGNLIIKKRSKPLSKIRSMAYGSKPTDGGNLILLESEKNELLEKYPDAIRLIKNFSGSDEFIKGNIRYCLWIEDQNLSFAKSIPPIRSRIENVYKMRLNSKKKATREGAEQPHKFAEIRYKNSNSIIIPSVTSEKREYLPIGFLNSDTIVSNSAHVILDAEPYLFGILSSRMHLIWVKATAGQLETRIRYSSAICYNNFPIPPLSDKHKETLITHVFNVLEEREKHSEKTIAALYDPRKMPNDLREAHNALDQAVERCYRSKPFTSDEERLEYLFKLYEEMTSNTQKAAVNE